MAAAGACCLHTAFPVQGCSLGLFKAWAGISCIIRTSQSVGCCCCCCSAVTSIGLKLGLRHTHPLQSPCSGQLLLPCTDLLLGTQQSRDAWQGAAQELLGGIWCAVCFVQLPFQQAVLMPCLHKAPLPGLCHLHACTQAEHKVIQGPCKQPVNSVASGHNLAFRLVKFLCQVVSLEELRDVGLSISKTPLGAISGHACYILHAYITHAYTHISVGLQALVAG